MAKAFADTHELIQFGRTFLSDRTESLQRDVQVCTVGATAAFPAILYCFSTIDLLGALLGGEAKDSKSMTERAKAYMRRFMNYDDRTHHLKLVPLVPPVHETVSSGLSFVAEQQFVISIRHLVADIVNSVHAPGGYLHTLALDADLQDKFTKAVTQIHEP